MSFGLGLILYIIGSALVALCVVAIPGPGGEPIAGAEDGHGHGHGSH